MSACTCVYSTEIQRVLFWASSLNSRYTCQSFFSSTHTPLLSSHWSIQEWAVAVRAAPTTSAPPSSWLSRFWQPSCSWHSCWHQWPAGTQQNSDLTSTFSLKHVNQWSLFLFLCILIGQHSLCCDWSTFTVLCALIGQGFMFISAEFWYTHPPETDILFKLLLSLKDHSDTHLPWRTHTHTHGLK